MDILVMVILPIHEHGMCSTYLYLLQFPFCPIIFWVQVPFLRIYLKKLTTLIWKNISTPMFIAALFTIAKIWKQPKCPSVDECLKQLWGIYTLEYCSTIKEKKILLFVTIWMDLLKFVLKWASQSKINAIQFHMYVESNEQTDLTSKTETDS